MSTQLAKGKQAVWQALQSRQKDLAAMLPRHMTAEQMTRLALIALNGQPKLLQCDPPSIVQAVMTAASLGLTIGGQYGTEAYLVPYGKACQLIVSYKGMISLARRSGQIKTIEAHCVYERDTLEYELGLSPKLVHHPHRGADRGDVVAAYAVAHFTDGGYQLELLWRDEIDTVRKSSKAGNSGPWVEWFDEMARKTAIRRLAKFLPLSADFSEAMAIEDGAMQSAGMTATQIVEALPESTSKSNRIAAALGANGSDEPEAPAEETTDDDAGRFSTFLVQAKKLVQDDGELIAWTRDALTEMGYDRDDIDFGSKTTRLGDGDLELVVSQIAQAVKR